MTKAFWAFITLAMIGITGGVVTACGSQGTHNDNKNVTPGVNPKLHTFNNADDYPNITAFCIGKNGVYTTTRDADAFQIVPNDVECLEGGKLYVAP